MSAVANGNPVAGQAGPLADLRVVELGEGTSAPFAAKLFSDYGADVVKIEGVHGDHSRQRGPFPGDVADINASGLFSYLNTNKRSIALDLDDPSSCAAVIEGLLSQADVFITNLGASHLAPLGLDPKSLRKRFPSLIVTVISPIGFDQTSSFKGSEIVSYSMGGLAYSTPGMPDEAEDLETEPPLHANCFAAETIAGAVAASATMGAIHARRQDGNGSLVEITEQAAVAAMLHRDFNNPSYLSGPFRHSRLFSPKTTGRMPNFYLPCKDGYVAIPAPLDVHWRKLVEAMGSPQWAVSEKFNTPAARLANATELKHLLSKWTVTQSGDYLFEFGQNVAGIATFNFYPIERMVKSAHATERQSVVPIAVGGTSALMPGAPAKLSRSPWQVRRPAPALGQHSEDIRREASGRSSKAKGASGDVRKLPLEGIRVLDLGQFIAAPFCTLWLAWQGAEVITIESRQRMTSRIGPPFAEGHVGDPDGSGYFNLLHGAKKSCTIDMTKPAGRDLVRELAGKSDVMIDNFSTGTLEKLGLDYQTISKINPRLIALSCAALGRTGALKSARGLHSAVNLFSGVADVTGYKDGAPRILGGCLPDPYAGMFGGLAIMMALHHRERTGDGQFIDLAMHEAFMTLIPEAVIDVSLNNRSPKRIGNRDFKKSPQGIYPCNEFDTWVALCVENEHDWAAFCEATGHREWLSDPRFETLEKRLAHGDDLDKVIEAWTRTVSCQQAVTTLQTAHIAAGPVNRPDHLLDDEYLQALGVVISTEHPLTGKRRQMGLPWRSDGAPPNYRRSPLLGEHTNEVLSKILGLDDAQIHKLTTDNVLA